MQDMATISIVRGWPGQGKSTWAKKKFDCLILENDMFMYQDGQYNWSPLKVKDSIRRVAEIAEDLASCHVDVCIANTFTKKKFVDFYKKMAEKWGMGFRVYRMSREYGSIHNVPEETLKNMKESFEDYPGEEFVE